MHEPSTQPDPSANRDPRQRWRLVLARGREAPQESQRELAETWERALAACGLPLARSDGTPPRARISFGAPLPIGMAADGELMDLLLTERWPIWRVREAVLGAVPPGWRLVELFDVWLAGPALAGQVAAADYRITLASAPAAGSALEPRAIERACSALLERPRLPRQRAKGSGTVTYDLRPLLIDLAVDDDGPPVTLAARTRFHPELGTGRPEEVVATLASELSVALTIDVVTRRRLILATDLDPSP